MTGFGSFLLYSAISAVIFLVIYAIFFHAPTWWENTKDKVESDKVLSRAATIQPTETTNTKTPESTDSTVTACLQTFNTCKEISEEKYGTSIYVIKVQKALSLDDGKDFYSTWKGYGQINLNSELNLNTVGLSNWKDDEIFPIVLIAIKIKLSLEGQEQQYPQVILCDSNGKLSFYSKNALGC